MHAQLGAAVQLDGMGTQENESAMGPASGM
jgi:hypothetical protein